MQSIPLYRYIRPDGGVTVSTQKPESEYTPMTRLVADNGYVLENGETTTYCTDTATPEAWTEITDPQATLEGKYTSMAAESLEVHEE